MLRSLGSTQLSPLADRQPLGWLAKLVNLWLFIPLLACTDPIISSHPVLQEKIGFCIVLPALLVDVRSSFEETTNRWVISLT